MNEQFGGKMRETLSALMDDSASELELHRVMRETNSEESLNATWSRYHLAASAMRKELPVDFVDSSAELRAAISMALVNEPLPQRRGQWGQAVGRVAIAASVAALAIFGAQQYQFFEPSASLPLVAQSDTQNRVQIKAGQTDHQGPQFQLPSGFEVPQATARTASTGSYNSSKNYTAVKQVEVQESSNSFENDFQIQAYMHRLMSQQANRSFRHSNSIFLPTRSPSEQASE
ncbi:MAG: sigma-E factor negative regulatory protein [Candidatus Reddybacter sp.]